MERVRPRRIGEQRLYITRFAASGVLVVYRILGIDDDDVSLGYGYLKNGVMGWHAAEAGGYGGPKRSRVLEVSISSPETRSNQTIVYGMVNDAQVEFVRIFLASGEVRQDSVTNHLFGIVIEPKQAVCRIELRDAQEGMLHAYHVQAGEIDVGGEIQHWAKEECK